jgi:hypothetical protein
MAPSERHRESTSGTTAKALPSRDRTPRRRGGHPDRAIFTTRARAASRCKSRQRCRANSKERSSCIAKTPSGECPLMPGLIIDASERVWPGEPSRAARSGTVASSRALLPRASDSRIHPVTTPLTSTSDASIGAVSAVCHVCQGRGKTLLLHPQRDAIHDLCLVWREPNGQRRHEMA